MCGRLPGDPFAWAGFFDIRPHGVQVVRGRDHREQQDEHAAQQNNCSQTAQQARAFLVGGRMHPNPDRWNGQHQPRDIKEQFHLG